MIITITGMPTVPVEKIAKLIANRLGLEFLTVAKNETAEDVIRKFENHNDFLLVTKYACLFKNSINICLYNLLCADPMFPKTQYDKYNEMLQTGKDELKIDDIFNPDLYAITVNTQGLPSQVVASSIVERIEDGILGDFVSPFAVLPATMKTSQCKPHRLEPRKRFYVTECFGCLYVFADYFELTAYAAHFNLINVQYVKDREPDLLPLTDYDNWFKAFSGNTIRMAHALALFCKDNDYKDVANTFVKLAENGDPYAKLAGMGYAV